MGNVTLNGIDLDKVENISYDKSANILPLPMPTRDSDETETFDMLGVIKTITVTGVFQDDPVSKVAQVEGLANGQQDSSVAFISPNTQSGSINVKVGGVRTTWQRPAFIANFEIILFEGQ